MMIIVVLSCYDCLFVSTDRSCCSYDSPLLICRQFFFVIFTQPMPQGHNNCSPLLLNDQCNSVQLMQCMELSQLSQFFEFSFILIPQCPTSRSELLYHHPPLIHCDLLCMQTWITYVDLDRLYHH